MLTVAQVLPAGCQSFPHHHLLAGAGLLNLSEGLLLVRAPVLYGDPTLAQSQAVNSLVNINTLRLLISSSWRQSLVYKMITEVATHVLY